MPLRTIARDCGRRRRHRASQAATGRGAGRRPRSRAPAPPIGDEARDVNLTLAGVQAGDGGDAGRTTVRMSSASASSDDTTWSGTRVGSASPLATAIPTRRPVKLPGPPPHATAASAAGAMPTARSASAHSGNTWLECRSAVASTLNRTPPPRSTIATRAVDVAVSRQSRRSLATFASTAGAGSEPRRCAGRIASTSPRRQAPRRWRFRALAATAAGA